MRMEATREAMGLMASAAQSREPYTPQVASAIAAALAEVEEWETRLAVAEHEAKGWIQHDTKSYAEATSRAIARAEAAEAERDRLQAALKATTDPASSWNLANNKETLKLRLEHFVHTTLNTT